MYETDRLALHLYVPNYRNPEQARYRFNREGAEFIQALPGPACCRRHPHLTRNQPQIIWHRYLKLNLVGL